MNETYQDALELARGEKATAAGISRIAGQTSPEAAQWAFTQWSLRMKARAKFALAERMLFQREALEQATHEKVARYRAARFPEGVLVADLTAGIGGDLMALAARGPAVGFEMDPERSYYAGWNLRAHDLEATIHQGDALTADWNFEYAVADPGRREGTRRLRDPNRFQPDPRELARRFAMLRLGCLKLSPLLDDAYLEALGGQLEFLSYGGECREASVWLGSSAGSGRSAVRVECGSVLPAGEALEAVSEPSAFLAEADPAAIRAHALGPLGGQLGMAMLADTNGYLTGPCEPEPASPWVKCYRVLRSGTYDPRRLKRAIADLGGGRPIVKLRGVNLEPDVVAKAAAGPFSRPLVAVLYLVGRSIRFAVCAVSGAKSGPP